VKELKDPFTVDELQPARFLWNPVKELKECHELFESGKKLILVESGEGIESLDPIAEDCVTPTQVESGEGIERLVDERPANRD